MRKLLTALLLLATPVYANNSPIIWGPTCAFNLFTNACIPSGGGVTSVTGTAPIVSSGGATPAISCTTATGSVAGCLSSTDWTSFNGKQASGSYITALTGDVTASGPNSAAATVASVGGSTAASVHTSQLLTAAATNSDTNATLVKRDGNGSFAITNVQDSGNLFSVRVTNHTLNVSAFVSMDWANGLLNSPLSGLNAINYSSLSLNDDTGQPGLTWANGNKALYYDSSVIGFDLSNFTINDSAGMASIQADARQLIDNSGGIQGTWNTSGFSAGTLNAGSLTASGVVNATGGIKASDLTTFHNAPSAFLDFSSGVLTGLSTNEILGGGKLVRPISIENMVVQANTFTCAVNPAVTLYDCGTSAGACTTGRTTIGTVTVTAANTQTISTFSSAIAAGHFWAFEISAGTCTAVNLNGSVEYVMQ